MKPRGRKRAGQRETSSAHNVLVGNLKGIYHLGDLVLNSMIILQLSLRNR
jgi:hypothetical protein